MPGAGHEDSEIGRRIYSAWNNSKYAHLPQQAILKMLGGITQSALSMYFSGERIPPVKRMIDIANLFDVSVEWLFTGRGPMKPDPRPYDQLAEQFMNCSPDHRELLRWCIGLLERGYISAGDMKKAVCSVIDENAHSFLAL